MQTQHVKHEDGELLDHATMQEVRRLADDPPAYLSPEQETWIAQVMECGRVAADRLRALAGDADPRIVAHYRMVVEVGRMARDILVLANIALVQYVISSGLVARAAHVDVDDLVQDGCIGLLYAADRYDPRRGRFSTYAVPWIAHAIRRAIQTTGSTIRVPVYVHRQWGRVRRAEVEMRKRLGRQPTMQEIADHVGLPVAMVADLYRVQQVSQVRSLWASMWRDHNGNLVFADSLAAPDDTVEEALRRLCNEQVVAAVHRLSERQQRAIILRFVHDLPLATIGRALGLSQARIRQVLAASMRTLRRDLHAWNPDDDGIGAHDGA